MRNNNDSPEIKNFLNSLKSELDFSFRNARMKMIPDHKRREEDMAFYENTMGRLEEVLLELRPLFPPCIPEEQFSKFIKAIKAYGMYSMAYEKAMNNADVVRQLENCHKEQLHILQNTITRLKPIAATVPGLNSIIDDLERKLEPFPGNTKYSKEEKEHIAKILHDGYVNSPQKSDRLKKSDAYAYYYELNKNRPEKELPGIDTLREIFRDYYPELFRKR